MEDLKPGLHAVRVNFLAHKKLGGINKGGKPIFVDVDDKDDRKGPTIKAANRDINQGKPLTFFFDDNIEFEKKGKSWAESKGWLNLRDRVSGKFVEPSEG